MTELASPTLTENGQPDAGMDRDASSGLLGTPRGELLLRLHGTVHDGEVIRLSSAKCTIGSGPNCTLRLRAPGVRRLHCLLLRGRQGTLVRRWSAETRVNGRSFTDAELSPGDRLTVGPLELEVLSDDFGPDRETQQLAIDAAHVTAATIAVGAQPAALTLERDFLAEAAAESRAVRRQNRARTERLIARVRELNVKLSEKLAEAEQLSQTESEAAQARQATEQQLTQTQSDNQQLRGELEAVRGELAQVQAEAAQNMAQWAEQRERWQRDHSQNDDALTELERNRQRLRTELESVRGQLAQVQSEAAQNMAQWAEQRERSQRDRSQNDAALAELESDLHRRQQELASRHDEFERRESAFNLRTAELDSRHNLLEETRTRLEDENMALQKTKAQLDKTRENLESRVRDLADQESRMCEQQAQLNQNQQEIERSREECRQLQQAIQQRHGELEAAYGELERLQNELIERQSRLQQRQQQLDELEGGLQQRHREIEDREADLSRRGAERSVAESLAAAGRQHAGSDRSEGGVATAEAGDESTDDAFERLREISLLNSNGAESSAASEDAAHADASVDTTPELFDSPESDHCSRPDGDPNADLSQSEESIEDYMSRLMERIRGGENASSAPSNSRKTTEQKNAPAAPSSNVRSPADQPAGNTTPGAAKESKPAPTPRARRVSPPERQADLAAMRDLANSSARAHIDLHALNRGHQAAVWKLLFAAAAFVVSMTTVVWSWSDGTLGFWAGMAGLAVAVYWTYQGTRLMRKFREALRDNATRAPGDAQADDASGSDNPTPAGASQA